MATPNLSLTISVDQRQALRDLMAARQALRQLEQQASNSTAQVAQAAQRVRAADAAVQQAQARAAQAQSGFARHAANERVAQAVRAANIERAEFDRLRESAREVSRSYAQQQQQVQRLRQSVAALARTRQQANQAGIQPANQPSNISNRIGTSTVNSAAMNVAPNVHQGGSIDASMQAADRLTAKLKEMGHATAWFVSIQQGLVPLIGKVVTLSDSYLKLNAQLKQGIGASFSLAQAQEDILRISTAAASSIEPMASLYARMSSSVQQLGVSQRQVAEITETVGLAMMVSGASANESASAILQLSQAFGAGVLRGEEFNAVNEAAPRLMQALADAMGRPRGELKKMAEDGLLTSALLSAALPTALGDLQREAAAFPTTVGNAFTHLNNQLTLFVGQMNAASGGPMQSLAGGIKALGDNLGVAFALAGTAFAAIITGMIHGIIKSRAAQAAAARAEAAERAQQLIAIRQQELAQARADAARATGFARHAANEAAVRAQIALTTAAQQASAAASVTALGRVAAAGRGLIGVLTGPVGLVVSIGMAAAAFIGFRDQGVDAMQAVIDKQRELNTLRDAAANKGVKLNSENQTYIQAEAAAEAASKLADKRLLEGKARAKMLQGLEKSSMGAVAWAYNKAGGAPDLAKLKSDADLAQQAMLEAASNRQAAMTQQANAEGNIRLELDKANVASRIKADADFAAVAKKNQATAADAELLALDKNAQDYGSKKRAIEAKKIDLEVTYQNKLLDLKNSQLSRAKPEEQTALRVEAAEMSAEINALTQKKAEVLSAQDKSSRGGSRGGAGKADNSVFRLTMEQDTQTLQSAYQQRQVSIADYFEQKTALEIKQASQEQQGHALVLRTTQITKANAQAEIQAQAELSAAREQAAYKLKELQGTLTRDDRRAQIAAEYHDLRQQLATNGQAEGVALMDSLINVRAARENLDALKTQWQNTMQTISAVQDNVRTREQIGAITPTQAQNELNAAMQQSRVILNELLPKMQGEARLISPDAVSDVLALETAMLRLDQQADSTAVTLNGQFQNAFETLFIDLTSGAEKASDAFRKFALSMVQSMQKVLAQKFAEQVFGSLMGGSGGGLGGFISGIFGGGSVARAATGGYIQGAGTGTSDSIPAMLSNGEYVIKADTVRQLGVGFLHNLNNGALIMRASGGAVGKVSAGTLSSNTSTTTTRSSAQNVAINVTVNADGSTTQSGNEAEQMGALGRMVSAKVRDVIMGEMRPGGLLGAR